MIELLIFLVNDLEFIGFLPREVNILESFVWTCINEFEMGLIWQSEFYFTFLDEFPEMNFGNGLDWYDPSVTKFNRHITLLEYETTNNNKFSWKVFKQNLKLPFLLIRVHHSVFFWPFCNLSLEQLKHRAI